MDWLHFHVLTCRWFPSHPERELDCWNIYSYDWNVELRRVSARVEAQQMGGEPQGGETVAKPLISLPINWSNQWAASDFRTQLRNWRRSSLIRYANISNTEISFSLWICLSQCVVLLLVQYVEIKGGATVRHQKIHFKFTQLSWLHNVAALTRLNLSGVPCIGLCVQSAPIT